MDIKTLNNNPIITTSDKIPRSGTGKPKWRPSSPILNLDLEIPDMMLWVKEDPFLFGILSPNPCIKIGVKVLKKVAEYCRDRKGYFPHLRFEEWSHISKYKLQLPTELSWTYLRTYHILSNGIDVQANMKMKDALDIKLEDIRSCSVDPLEEIRVDTLQFLIFLYIQNFSQLQKKYNRHRNPSFDDHWPSEQRTPSSSPSNSSASFTSISSNKSPTLSMKRKPIPEHAHAGFVETNLLDLTNFLHLVFVKQSKAEENSSSEARIPIKLVGALSFIIGAASVNGKPNDTEFSTLDECITAIPVVARAVGYQMDTRTVDKHRFILWVKTNLKMNPWGPSSAPVPQHGVKCLSGIWQKTKAYEINRIYWNTQLYPKGWYLISTVNSQVLYLDPVTPLSSLKVHRCSDSYIYVPGAFSSIIVDKCHDCSFYFGPAAKFVKFVECSNLRVSALGRTIVFQDVSKSSFNFLTPCHPIICGDKGKKIVLGPYNTFYPQLERHMEMVGLGVKIQKWNRPLELDPQGVPLNRSQPSTTATTLHDHVSICSTMQTEAFTKIVFPFAMDGPTFKNPCELPRNYARKLASADGVMSRFKTAVSKAKLVNGKQELLNSIIQARFHIWLKKEGHLHQLRGLRSIQKSVGAGSNVPILETKKSIREEKRKLGRSRSTGSNSHRNSNLSGDENAGIKLSDQFFVSDPSTPDDDRRSNNTGAHLRKSSSLYSPIGDTPTSSARNRSLGYANDNESDDDVFLTNGEDGLEVDSIFFLDGSSGEDEDEDETEAAFERSAAQRRTKRKEDEDEKNVYEGDNVVRRRSQRSSFNSSPELDDGILWSPI